MVLKCSVTTCFSRDKTYKMFKIPGVDIRAHSIARERAEKRQKLWLKACGLPESTAITRYHRVCIRHFVQGAPAPMYDVNNVDWVPTLNLEPLFVSKHENGANFSERSGANSAVFTLASGKSLSGTDVPEVPHTTDGDEDDIDWVIPPNFCENMEDPERSEAARPEVVASDYEDHRMEPGQEDLDTDTGQEGEEEYIGVDPQETRNSYENDSNFEGFADLLSTEIEIKEEEIEIKEEEIEIKEEEIEIKEEEIEIKEEEIEIKEEEIELEPGLLPEWEGENDPFGGMDATDTAEELVVSEPPEKKRKVGDGNVMVKLPKPERLILPKPTNVPQFVPGMMTTVGPSANLLCLECGLCFRSAVSFAAHRKELHVQLPDFRHPCSYCKRKFNTLVGLQRHLLHHTRLETFRCSVCHLDMKSSKTLADHLADHRKSHAHQRCNLCALQFSSAEQLEAHNVDLHMQLPKVSKVVKPTDLICFACGWTEQTAKNLHNHMRLHQGAVTCRICDSSISSIEKLAIHVAKFHKGTQTISYDYCPNYYMILLSQQQKIKHNAICALPRSFRYRFRLECHICNMSYFDVEHYETHMRLHATLGQESDQRACRLCSFFSKNASEYALHMTTVHGFRDTVESLENCFDKIPGIICVVPQCRRTPEPTDQPFHHLPDQRAQPERWNHLVRLFGLSWNFEPRPNHRICSAHWMLLNSSRK